MSADVTKELLEALKGLLVRVADDEEYGPDHAVTIARAAIARAEAALSSSDDTPPSAEERRLRRMLCRQRHGLSAYMDDGEATFGGDEFQRPTDYLRESLDSIEQAWIEAGLKQAALAEPQPDANSAPIEAIRRILTEVMDEAARNGAGSRSMPDDYVEVAAWLCGVSTKKASQPDADALDAAASTA